MGYNLTRMHQKYKCQGGHGTGKAVLTLWRCLANRSFLTLCILPLQWGLLVKQVLYWRPVGEGFQEKLSSQSSPFSVSCLYQVLRVFLSSWPRVFCPRCSGVIYLWLGIYSNLLVWKPSHSHAVAQVGSELTFHLL